MKKDEITPYLIEGEWDWRDISASVSKGWILLSEMCKGEHIWCFRADGVMTSQENGRTKYVVRYLFDWDRLRLVLNGFQINDEGEPHTFIYEQYRVYFNTRSELFLYDLEDVAAGLEEESLRLRFQRVFQS